METNYEDIAQASVRYFGWSRVVVYEMWKNDYLLWNSIEQNLLLKYAEMWKKKRQE